MADKVRSVNARAISATTNVFDRRLAAAPADARTPLLSTALGAMRLACQSGARPASTPVVIAAAVLKPSTFQSIVTPSATGMNADAAATSWNVEDPESLQLTLSALGSAAGRTA